MWLFRTGQTKLHDLPSLERLTWCFAPFHGGKGLIHWKYPYHICLLRSASTYYMFCLYGIFSSKLMAKFGENPCKLASNMFNYILDVDFQKKRWVTHLNQKMWCFWAISIGFWASNHGYLVVFNGFCWPWKSLSCLGPSTWRGPALQDAHPEAIDLSADEIG